MPLLNALSDLEKMIVADSLTRKEVGLVNNPVHASSPTSGSHQLSAHPKYQAGDHIITEGTAGDEFFIIEEGQVVCTRSSE